MSRRQRRAKGQRRQEPHLGNPSAWAGLQPPRTWFCPDCGKVSPSLERLHHPTCPVEIGVQAAVADDDAWFGTHPAEQRRVRPVTWAEAQEFKAAGPPVARTDRVEVQVIGTGRRQRRLVTAKGQRKLGGIFADVTGSDPLGNAGGGGHPER